MPLFSMVMVFITLMAGEARAFSIKQYTLVSRITCGVFPDVRLAYEPLTVNHLISLLIDGSAANLSYFGSHLRQGEQRLDNLNIIEFRGKLLKALAEFEIRLGDLSATYPNKDERALVLAIISVRAALKSSALKDIHRKLAEKVLLQTHQDFNQFAYDHQLQPAQVRGLAGVTQRNLMKAANAVRDWLSNHRTLHQSPEAIIDDIVKSAHRP